jgi:DNA-directed RNA polymerase specialized sigma24 family protein
LELDRLAVADLARRCHEETLRFLRAEPHDDGFCFALFELAVAQRDHAAWEAIITQYRGIVLSFVTQHSASRQLRETDEYWVNRAFQRFWMALTPDRFSRFPDLPALLKYLKMCVHSVLLDELRARRVGTLRSLDEVPDTAPADTDAEQAAVASVSRQQLWQVILRELNDDAERAVAFLSFARDLKPADIQRRHPELYASVSDVYRIKRNLLERLRRNPDIQAFIRG